MLHGFKHSFIAITKIKGLQNNYNEGYSHFYVCEIRMYMTPYYIDRFCAKQNEQTPNNFFKE